MDKLQAVVTYLVANFPRALSRIELVKLVYFVELEFQKLYGRSLTGVQFIRYLYGPFSPDILQATSELACSGVVQVRETRNCYGKPKYQHVLVHNPGDLGLTGEECNVIEYVIEMNRALTTTAIKDKSYKTAPMNRILETEKELNYTNLWEELDMSFINPKPQKRSLKRIKKAFAKVDLSNRGSIEDYNKVILKEKKDLEPFLKRAVELE